MFCDMQIEFFFHLELLLALAVSDTKCIFSKRSLLTQRLHENIRQKQNYGGLSSVAVNSS